MRAKSPERSLTALLREEGEARGLLDRTAIQFGDLFEEDPCLGSPLTIEIEGNCESSAETHGFNRAPPRFERR
jgi:hypothetical protein